MHMSYMDTVNRIAENYWGQEFENAGQAQQAMMADKQGLAAFAAVELLRRLEAMATAMGGRKRGDDVPKVYVPEDVAKLADVSVGDRLYEYNTEYGLIEFIVVAKSDDDMCLMVMLNDFDLRSGPSTRIADSYTKRTKEEAMRHGAMHYIKVWGSEVEFSRRLLYAIDEKLPLDEFIGGFVEDDE